MEYAHIMPEDILKNPEVKVYVEAGNSCLGALGFTEHGRPHAKRCSNYARNILEALDYDKRTCELAAIAGYLHDIGNIVNRTDHAQSGAVMAFRILDRLGADAEDIAKIVAAIGNHDEGTGVPVSAISAALIIADKTDVRYTRVRKAEFAAFDIHDRVNFAVREASTTIDDAHENVTLTMTIDTQYCSVMDYFEIFLKRMLLCRKAAEKLGLKFRLTINGQTLL